MPTRAVLFDLGNTLVSYYRADEFPGVLRRCLGGCLGELNRTTSAEPDEELLNRALALNREAPDHTVWPLSKRLIELFPESLNDSLLLERLCSSFLQPIFATARLDPDALSVLESLRMRGQSLAIVSNTPWGSAASSWREELLRHGLLAAVDATVFCADVGFRKPHPAPIRRALEALNVSPGDAIFVGDDMRWDVLGSRAVGVRPLLLVPAEGGDAASDGVPVIHRLKDVLEYVAAAD